MKVELTRDEVVTIAQAVEFRDESSGPHVDANRELAERIRGVLRVGLGDDFAIVDSDT